MENILVNTFLIIAYILLGLTLITAVVLPLIYFVKNFDFAKAKGSFISVGILLLILFLSYAVSSGELGTVHEQFGISATQSKFIGGAIITTYILIIGTIIASIYSEVANKIR